LLKEVFHITFLLYSLSSHKSTIFVPFCHRLLKVLEVCEIHKIDGYILTNTTKSREALKTSAAVIEGIGKGGLSGQPLRQKSTEVIKHAYKILKRPCIIGLGGINSAEAAYEKIKAGASLVQVYTGLIYEGPGLVKKINKGLVELLKRDGFKNVDEAVGVEAQ
jgi:dihydroorotate dehydrogenase